MAFEHGIGLNITESQLMRVPCRRKYCWPQSADCTTSTRRIDRHDDGRRSLHCRRSQSNLPPTQQASIQNAANTLQMQEFSEWMTTLQQQQHSPASSYAETDVTDSDSDSDCQCRLEPKRKSVTKDAHHVWTRTEPISIPSNSRLHPHLCESVTESPDLSYHADMRLLRAGRYLHEDEDTLDEDDPAFYGNLAFFRSQYGASQTRIVKRSVHPIKPSSCATSPTAVDEIDEDIFDMEL